MSGRSSAVRVLSFHAGYGCHHTGRCCSSNWPIPIDTVRRADWQRALDERRLTVAAHGADACDMHDGVAVVGRRDGRCVFHDATGDCGCQVQRALGHEALPLACRQFPRQSVRDPRGTSITLSHYCPTARGQLDRATGPVAIVDGDAAFPADGEYVGLEASPDVPPLLHPRCLITWEDWWSIEARAVALVSAHPETALPRLARVIDDLHAWKPGDGALGDVIGSAFDRASTATCPPWAPTAADVQSHIADALDAVPREWHTQALQALLPGKSRLAWPVFGRFLSAHVFASWAAYNGRGLRTWFRAVDAAGCLVWHTGDPGATDLILRHLADSSALIARWNQAEGPSAIRRP